MEQVVNVEITAVPLCAQAFFLLLGGKRFPAERCRHLSNTFATKIRKLCDMTKPLLVKVGAFLWGWSLMCLYKKGRI